MATPSEAAGRRVLVWDLPTRLFHWILVASITGSWATAKLGYMDIHVRLGFVALTLVSYRLIWGLVGSESARFSAFLRGPGAVLHHLRELVQHRRSTPDPGHNAAGGLAVVGLLALVGFQATTGLFANDGILTEGPFASRVTENTSKLLTSLHVNNFNLLLALIGLHVTAIAVYRVVGRRNLLAPMVTGYMTLPAEIRAPRVAPLGRALLVLAGCGAVIWAVLTWL